MAFLASYWYLFLILWNLSLAYVFYNQINRMKRIMRSVTSDEDDDPGVVFFEGIYLFVIGIVVNFASFILMFIGILAKIL